MNTSRVLRVLSGLLVPVWFVALTALPLLLFRQRLPDPLTTNWGFGGTPRGTMAWESFLILCLVFTIAAGLIAVFASLRTRGVSITLGAAWFHGAPFAAISLVVVHANLDAAVASEAGRMPPWRVLLVLAGAGALGWAGSRIGRLLEDPASPVVPTPGTGVAPPAGATWTGTASSRWALPATIAMVCFGLALATTVQPNLGMILAATGLICLLFTNIRVEADHQGLRIAYGPLKWPVQRIPLDEIQRATVVDIKPGEWGGWGYRGMLRILGKAAIVLRAGPGIVLELTRKRRLAVTVDDAETGAGFLNDLLAGLPEHPADSA